MQIEICCVKTVIFRADINVMIINFQKLISAFDEKQGNSVAKIINSKHDDFGNRNSIDEIVANQLLLWMSRKKWAVKQHRMVSGDFILFFA